MSTRIEYLKRCVVESNCLGLIAWYKLAFAIPVLKPNDTWQNETHLTLVTQADGLYYVTKETETPTLVKIIDHVKDKPLYAFQEIVEVDTSWLPTIQGKIQTKIGVLIINSIVLYQSVKTKLPYLNQSISCSSLEELLINKSKDDDVATDKDISVTEMNDCLDRLSFFSNLAFLTSVASTKQLITKPPNMDKQRTELLKEYKDQLNDPTKLVELEKKLEAIDTEYLNEDPNNKKILTKKLKVGRKKLQQIYGDTNDFVKEGQVAVVAKSLDQGIDTSEGNFEKYMNDMRYGSYARGASTALSGYAYKVIQRSLSGLKISPVPCNTTQGLLRKINESNYKKLLGRYVKEGKTWKLIDDVELANKYKDKVVEMRTTIHCTSPGNTVCYACVADSYKDTPNGITNIGANISSSLMGLFLSLMHGSSTETTTISTADLIT